MKDNAERTLSDLINREALKEDLAKEIQTNDMGLWLKILLVIDNAQAVDISGNEYFPYRTAYFNGVRDGRATARPKGEWVNREAVSNTIFPFWERYECNQCHKFNGYSKFCPNCGAKMQGGAE